VEGILVPIAMFAALAVILSFMFMFGHRSKRELQQTIRSAVERGQELTPELVKSLGKHHSKDRDLRCALIWLGIAAGTALFGLGMGQIEEDVFSIMLAISAMPFMIGIAYVVMWRFTERPK
jgi:uncharacterized protein YqhQ